MLERFAPFLTFYQSAGELVRIVEERSIAAPPDAAMRATFLANCSWESRVEEVLRAIAGKRRR